MAQKLVTIESLSAKTASGAVSAAQKLAKPLLVPKMKIDESGRNTSGNIMSTSTPMLRGRATSKPRTCRIEGITFIANCQLPIAVSALSLDQFRFRPADAPQLLARPALVKSAIGNALLPPLHLIPEDSFNHFGIGLNPTAKVINRNWHLDVSQLVVFPVQCIIGN
ncbi:hypothetical protein BH20ACI3_BH20ACI3_29160 [soil metagenome]